MLGLHARICSRWTCISRGSVGGCSTRAHFPCKRRTGLGLHARRSDRWMCSLSSEGAQLCDAVPEYHRLVGSSRSRSTILSCLRSFLPSLSSKVPDGAVKRRGCCEVNTRLSRSPPFAFFLVTCSYEYPACDC